MRTAAVIVVGIAAVTAFAAQVAPLVLDALRSAGA